MLTIRHQRAPVVVKPANENVEVKVEKPKPNPVQIAEPTPLPTRIRAMDGSIEQILQHCSDKFGTTPEQILSRMRIKHIVNARKEFICILHFKYNYSPGRIAVILNIDHTSVKHLLGLRKSSKETYESLKEIYS